MRLGGEVHTSVGLCKTVHAVAEDRFDPSGDRPEVKAARSLRGRLVKPPRVMLVRAAEGNAATVAPRPHGRLPDVAPRGDARLCRAARARRSTSVERRARRRWSCAVRGGSGLVAWRGPDADGGLRATVALHGPAFGRSMPPRAKSFSDWTEFHSSRGDNRELRTGGDGDSRRTFGRRQQIRTYVHENGSHGRPRACGAGCCCPHRSTIL
jgi:hypothetical protein